MAGTVITVNQRSASCIDIHVGRQIRARRTMLGLSQCNIADAVGISYQQVQKYENGINRISASRLFFMAQHLGVSISYFYEGATPLNEDESDKIEENFPNLTEMKNEKVKTAMHELISVIVNKEKGAD